MIQRSPPPPLPSPQTHTHWELWMWPFQVGWMDRLEGAGKWISQPGLGSMAGVSMWMN